MAAYLGFFVGMSLDPLMWFVIIVCTWLIKKRTLVSAIISTIIFVVGWMIIFRVFVLESPPIAVALIMSIITTVFWGTIVGFFWNRKRNKSNSQVKEAEDELVSKNDL